MPKRPPPRLRDAPRSKPAPALIVENIELFMGDVQNGLSESLRAVPKEEPDGYLDDWERNNPLIQTTFRTDAQRRLIRPRNDPSNTPIRASLEAWLAARNQKIRVRPRAGR
jgi:hypothetical protein